MGHLVTKTIKTLAIPAVLVVALGSALPAQAASPPTWVPRASLPTPLEGHCTAAIGDKIFTAYGFSPGSGDTKGLRIFDIAKNNWSLGPSAPSPAHSEGYRGVSHGGKLYCIGGRGPGGALSGLERFDPSSGTWTTLASMPDARAGTTAAVLGDSIFVFGGRKGTAPCNAAAVAPGATTTILRYEIAKNSWSNAGNLAVNRSDATVARVGDGIFVFGGCSGSTTFASVEVYNPHTLKSTLLPVTMPGGPRSDAAAARHGHLIHVTGGFNRPSGPAAAFNHLVFNSHTNTFTVGTPMPTHCAGTADRAEFELVSHDDRLFAVGGSCPAFGASVANVDMLKLDS